MCSYGKRRANANLSYPRRSQPILRAGSRQAGSYRFVRRIGTKKRAAVQMRTRATQPAHPPADVISLTSAAASASLPA